MDRGFKQETIAAKLGISQSSIANKIRLLSLPKSVQNSLLYNKISERHARCLLTLNNEEQQRELLNRIINERLTVKQTEEEVSKIINKEKGIVEEPNTEFKEFDPSKMKSVVTIDNMPPLEYFDPKNFDIKVGATVLEKKIDEENKNLLNSINNKDNNSDNLIENMDVVPEITVIPDDEDKYSNINPFQEKRGLIDQILNNVEEQRKTTIEQTNKPNNYRQTVDRIRRSIKELNIKESAINTTEIDLDDKYRIIIEIDKDAL